MDGRLTQSLALQWKASRWALIPFVLAGFGLPLLAMRQAQSSATASRFGGAYDLLQALQAWVPIFPLLAALLGLTVGLAAWSWDHRVNHVYALSLPVQRWEYALLKLAAGAIVLMIPVAAVLAGATLGASIAELPDGLRAYPFSFTFRFLLTALIMYATAFAVAAGTMRTAIWLLSGFLFFLIFGTIAVGFAEEVFGLQDLWTPLDIMNAALGRWPGPFHLFGGNWMPIDV